MWSAWKADAPAVNWRQSQEPSAPRFQQSRWGVSEEEGGVLPHGYARPSIPRAA